MAKLTRLTEAKLQKIQAPSGAFIADITPNLYVRVSANGAHSFFLNFTELETKKRIKWRFGVYPNISLDEARKMALQFMELLRNGIDPRTHKASQDRADEIAKVTFKDVAERWREFKREELKHIDDKLRRVEMYIYPHFADMPLSEINRGEWIAKLEPLEKSKNDTLLKICSTCSQILDQAVIWDLITENPLKLLRSAFKKTQSENLPSINPRRLPEFLRDLYLSDRQRITKRLIEWQLLTATRPSEAASAEWNDIDLERKIWTIPADKMKMGREHSIPLSSQALEILDEMLTYYGRGKYVFPNRNNRNEAHIHEQSANNAIKKICNGKYKGGLVAHGFRSIFSTYANSKGEEYILIEASLAHAIGGKVSQAYNRSNYLELRRPLMQRWGDYVEACKHS